MRLKSKRLGTRVLALVGAALALAAWPAPAPAGPLYARLTVLELAEPPEQLDAVLTVVLIHREPFGAEAAVKFPGLKIGAPSDWMELSAQLADRRDVATAGIRLSTGGQIIARPARVRIELARAPGGPILAATELRDPKAILNCEIPERGVPDTGLADILRGIARIASDHLAAAAPFKVSNADRPRRFMAATQIYLFQSMNRVLYSDPLVARNEIQAVLDLGYNTLTEGGPTLKQADEAGVPFLALADYQPPGRFDAEAARQHYRGRVQPLVAHDGDTRRLRAMAMSDEPSWSIAHFATALAANTAGVARFHAYLRERALAPSDLGARSWADTLPATNPPPPGADPPIGQRRRWYHTVRFAMYDLAAEFSIAAEALRREAGDQVLGFVNWNNPGLFYYDLSRWRPDEPVQVAHDWFVFSRLRGSTCLWLGPGLSENRTTWRNWSLMLNLLRSAAAEGVGRFGAYVHHEFIPDERGYEAALGIMAVAAHGGAGYNSYLFGPRYAWTEYMWSEKLGHYEHIADANRLIGRAERLIAGAVPPPAEAAVLWPVTSQIHEFNRGGCWTANRDYLVESQQIWLALNHHFIPADFVDEVTIQRGLPKRLRVLYLAAPHLEAATVAAIKRWVQGGGLLWTSARAMSRDESDLPSAAAADILGVSARKIERDPEADCAPRGGLRTVPERGVVSMQADAPMGAGPWTNYGCRAILEPASGARVCGRFEDGKAAILINAVGRGQSWHLAGLPGLAYSRGASETPGRPTIDYPERVAQLICAAADQAGVSRPATADRTFVETAVLESERGLAVALLNWSAQPLAELAVSVRDHGRAKRISSARLGALKFKREGETLRVRLPMPRVIDVLLVDFKLE